MLATSQSGMARSQAICCTEVCKEDWLTGRRTRRLLGGFSWRKAGMPCSLRPPDITTAHTSTPAASNARNEGYEKLLCMPRKMTRGDDVSFDVNSLCNIACPLFWWNSLHILHY